MSSEPQIPPSDPGPPAEAVPEQPQVPPRRRRRHPILRTLGVLVAIVIALIVATLPIDLGPALRKRAETAGSKYIERPMHIGRLRVKLLTGQFVVENLVIDGLHPGDRPFLTARRVAVNMPWWSIVHRELIISDVDMSDWNMLIEQFKDGHHNFPKFVHPKPPNQKPGRKLFTTTVGYVIARNGQFTYEDHGTPWSVVCRNLNVTVFRAIDTYRGTAQFTNGTVAIQSYLPFRTDMQTRFKIDGGKVLLDHIDIETPGATAAVNGSVDLAHWPEMFYNVKSHVDFPTEKNIFFRDMKFTTSGQGDFTGTFHFFKGGRELKGTFTSPEAGVDAWRFSNVAGSLLWVPEKFEVSDVTMALYGGRAKMLYSIGPFGKPTPANDVWDATYSDVDLTRLSDFLELKGIRLAGRLSGHNRLVWPSGKFSQKRGTGEVTAVMPSGVTPMTREPPAGVIARVDPLPPEQGPFNAHLPVGHVPMAGHITYTLDPGWITIADGWAATDETYVSFDGRTAWGAQSRIPFHVTSVDWQESDRLLAGIMTAFGAPTGAIPIGGRGIFDGTMLGRFGDPRIEGHFVGERMRAWDVVWGHAVADLVIENAYVYIKGGDIREAGSAIQAEGKFSLGYPRKDHGEEINASIRMTQRPLGDLRHAFALDDYPVDGLASGEFHLYGMYTTPDGYGKLEIDKGKAYGEPFDVATSNLVFQGTGTAGVRLDGIDIHKGPTGHVTGAAFVGWDGTYSFDATGRRIPVESIASLSFPRAPLSGMMQFDASGSGRFDSPRYDVKIQIADLFAGDEGIGQVSGRLSLRNQMLTMEVDAASPRLSVTGSGRLALTPEMDTEMTLRFTDTSLDPYLRFFQPKMSPFTTAVADGSIRVAGELADINHLLVEARVDQLKLTLFDYPVRNDGPIELALKNDTIEIQRFRLAGEGTALELQGEVGIQDNRLAVDASGDASLGILQGFFRDIRTSGTASLQAHVRGPLDAPVFSGSATIKDGRFRYVTLPHSLQAINARLSFDAQGIRVDEGTAELGGGAVRLGGRIGMKGYMPSTLNLTATGEQMHLRYPEGFRSVVDASLTLRGDVSAPVLSGTVNVLDGLYSKRIETNVDIFNLTGGSTGLPGAAPAAPSFPLKFDIQIHAPSTLRVENNVARLVSRADLTLGGTYDKPLLFGRAEIEHGEILFEGNRYLVTRGTIDFSNPARIEPFFDVEAETRIRVPAEDETYRITLAVNGTLGAHMNLQLNSDPPLPTIDIIQMLFGQTTDVSSLAPELRAVRGQDVAQSEEALLRLGLTQFLTAPIYAPVTRAVESSLGIDTVTLSPTLGTATDPLTPTARLIIGKRLSDRAYLTFSRALGTTVREQIIVLEYDQSDRVGWILTQSSDRSFSIDFRVRRSF